MFLKNFKTKLILAIVLLIVCIFLICILLIKCSRRIPPKPTLKNFKSKSSSTPWKIPTWYKYSYLDPMTQIEGELSASNQDGIQSDSDTNPIIQLTTNSKYSIVVYRAVGNKDSTFFKLNVSVQADGTFIDTQNPSTYNDKIQFLNEKNFFGISSTDGKNGVDVEGNYKVDSTITEKGFQTKADLSLYPLTFPFGHPFYQDGYGYIKNYPSWKEYVNSLKTKTNVITATTSTPSTSDQNVIVIQDHCLAILASSITIKGIVVRRGGVLLIDDSDIKISTEFILIESGGLFQAGCNYDNNYRFQSNLNITLTNPSYGYRYMGEVASQYSYNVYFPGAKGKIDAAGEQLMMNTFGTKVVAVGFNGSLHLAGLVGASLPYMGTWGATDITDPSNPTPFVDQTRLMTWFDPTKPEEQAKADDLNISTSYPNVWCRLQDGSYKKGDTTISLDPRDVQSGVLSQWRPGYKIVLTCKTDIFQEDANISGMVPIWLDYDENTPNYNDNITANTTPGIYQSVPTTDKKYLYNVNNKTGVEVATIKSINGNIITLKSRLQFNHNSTRDVLKNTLVNKTIRVDTNTHVALLTRNILITSERTEEGVTSAYETRGCNLWEDPTPPSDPSSYLGPKGHVVCNYKEKTGPPVNCYKNKPNKYYEYYCGENPSAGLDGVQGHWLIGTAGQKGCNAIQSGSTMFRYGSSVTLDAVELKYMGQPANFGTIGRYAIHFHLAGWIKSFKGYLPSDEFSREGLVANCSMWCCPSRWIVTHGSSEVLVRNNVGFISYGSGYFVEDGTELYNHFEHNTAICCLTTVKNAYWNPIPILGNTASDLAIMSCYWFKNNQTISFRNLGCNCPGSTMHTWYVPQNITIIFSPTVYSPPSAICTGDADLELPTIGGTESDTLCYIPEYMKTDKKKWNINNCLAFVNVNTSNPYIMSSENIAYCLCGGMSEFPEGLSIPPGTFTGSNKLFINQPMDGDINPQYLAFNGENSCTDQFVGTYSQTTWGGTDFKHYAYQPLSEAELTTYKNTNMAVTTQNVSTTIVPKIFSHWLTFNLGPDGNGLFGGAAWIKQSPAFLIGCCALKTGGGISYPNAVTTTGNNPSFADTSTNWAMLVAINPDSTLPNGYTVIYDHITNGKICIPATATYIGGERTFLDDNTSTSEDVEFTFVENQTSVFYISDNLLPFFKCTGQNQDAFNKFWKGFNVPSKNTIRIYDMVNKQYYDNNVSRGTFPDFIPTNKYPYMCSDTGSLRNDGKDIMINSQLRAFINTYGISIGNAICKNLSIVIGCDGSPTGNNTNQRYCSKGLVPPQKKTKTDFF
jgi:hypothetical protein